MMIQVIVSHCQTLPWQHKNRYFNAVYLADLKINFIKLKFIKL